MSPPKESRDLGKRSGVRNAVATFYSQQYQQKLKTLKYSPLTDKEEREAEESVKVR